MKASFSTISPNGFSVTFETPEEQLDDLLKHLPRLEQKLSEAGYMANAERLYPKTPTGEPICPKHGEVMRLQVRPTRAGAAVPQRDAKLAAALTTIAAQVLQRQPENATLLGLDTRTESQREHTETLL